MANIFRSSRHPLVTWWWSMDRTTYVLILLLMIFGAIVAVTASGAVAARYEVDAYYFARRQFMFLGASFFILTVLSFSNKTAVARLGLLLFLAGIAGLILTFFIGTDVKGAARWINIAGFKVQPTEFLKTGLILLNAWLLSPKDSATRFRNFWISCAMMAIVALLIILQPNFSMVVLIGAIWFSQVFISGVSLMFIWPFFTIGIFVLIGVYMFMPHVRARLERFIDPNSGDSYQIDQAREAFLSGGLSGRGFGEGTVKYYLPDAHTDFIFSLIGEEFGVVGCLILLSIFIAIIVRGFARVINSNDRFITIAGSGLLSLFSFHVLINTGVALRLLPTTGMTLPFISYGGSSTMALAIAMGFLLALMRRREGDTLKRKKGR